MQRAIIAPAVLSAAALAELKEWLAITTMREDAALVGLLRAALETCEAFTRQVPLVTTYEEIHEPLGGWQVLGLSPVSAILGIEGIAADGSRLAIAPESYLLDLGAGGEGRFRLLNSTGATNTCSHL